MGNKTIIYAVITFIVGLAIGLWYGDAYGLPLRDQGQKSKAFMEMEYDDSGETVGGSGQAAGSAPAGPAGGSTSTVGPAGGASGSADGGKPSNGGGKAVNTSKPR